MVIDLSTELGRAVVNLRASNGGTDILLRVRNRIQAIRTFVFGGPLLRPGDDLAPGILAFVLNAYKKFPISLVSTGILVVIVVAHSRCSNHEGTEKSNSVSLGKTNRENASFQSKAAIIKCC